MRAYHNTRSAEYRQPFGAVGIGTEITLKLDVWEDPASKGVLRTWVDGVGASIAPMEKTYRDGFVRFSITLKPETPQLLWYSFIIERGDGSIVHYGAKPGRTGGEGELYDWEPPSFQITVSRERIVPDWYKNGIVYQIFPDRFNRSDDWRERAEEAFKLHQNGPKRDVVEDWYADPVYKKYPDGSIAEWDFYGGTLKGIAEKFGYLRDMGVTALYLNPIFEAASNHRYDTGDYTKIDPLLGTNDDFEKFCKEADKYGISIILDGVFNHTGSDSLYFNKSGNYDSVGAYQSPASPYRDWFTFDDSAIGYDCWWGIDNMPNVDESAESYRDFIYRGKNSIVRRWLRAGAKGWRLDVADELPDDFIAGIKKAIVEEKPEEGLLLGEVWEDASNKISYSKLRSYLLGDELDSAMNYPLRDGVQSFIKEEITAGELYERLMSLYENYPHEAFYGALNLLGSHDRPRIMTILGDAPEADSLSDYEKRTYRLSDGQRGLAKGRLWLTVLLQMTMPGVPCIYYGDEAGLEGYTDPYNRAAFPWGKTDADVEGIYRNALSLRKMNPIFVDGGFEPFYQGDDVFGFFRTGDTESAAVIINRSRAREYDVEIPALGDEAAELVAGARVVIKDGKAKIRLHQMGSAVIHFYPKKRLAAPMERGSGVLCHITSLVNEGGAGTLGKPALDFVDFLRKSKQKYWQILPLNPTDEHGSPYAGKSAFAGNIELLGKTEEELRASFAAFRRDGYYENFCRQNDKWLKPFAMFYALKEKYDFKAWQEWPKKYRKYSEKLYDDAKLARSAEYHIYCQFLFQNAWNEVRKRANAAGIAIIGDMPMYVSSDSADAWAEPELFRLNADGNPALVAGVPPDYFSKDGQLWGNPLYDWEKMRETGYDWWMRRLERAFKLYDYTRLDHFRGFEAYWAVPYGKKATEGKWLFGPGAELFETAYEKFGPLPLIAEDLGMITPAVRGLVARCGFAGTDVMEFANNPLEGYTPPEGKIAYSGTHDNATLVGWCEESYPEREPHQMAGRLLENLYASSAKVVIVPLQDVLGLGDEARMNLPGTTGANWKWQAKKEDFSGGEESLLKLTINTNRS